jgi:hypothetical protein
VGSGSEFPTLLVGFHFFSPKFPVPEPQQTRQKNQVFIRQNTEHRENRHQPKRQTEVDSSRTQHVLTPQPATRSMPSCREVEKRHAVHNPAAKQTNPKEAPHKTPTTTQNNS